MANTTDEIPFDPVVDGVPFRTDLFLVIPELRWVTFIAPADNASRTDEVSQLMLGQEPSHFDRCLRVIQDRMEHDQVSLSAHEAGLDVGERPLSSPPDFN
ncbi:hypothetical protein AYO38_09455 [bacterium SCGC AG-212-C10]|nr:hypothetical protein AYO38_09455 [bacterium SCGC AG-212-C10]